VKHATTYLGCVGKDDYAAQMCSAAEKDGVHVAYKEVDDTPTGTCAVLVTGKERCVDDIL